MAGTSGAASTVLVPGRRLSAEASAGALPVAAHAPARRMAGVTGTIQVIFGTKCQHQVPALSTSTKYQH